jgi:hypothetical protein
LHAITDVQILLVGNSGVGKSCILMRFTADRFEETTTSTIGEQQWPSTSMLAWPTPCAGCQQGSSEAAADTATMVVVTCTGVDFKIKYVTLGGKKCKLVSLLGVAAAAAAGLHCRRGSSAVRCVLVLIFLHRRCGTLRGKNASAP